MFASSCKRGTARQLTSVDWTGSASQQHRKDAINPVTGRSTEAAKQLINAHRHGVETRFAIDCCSASRASVNHTECLHQRLDAAGFTDSWSTDQHQTGVMTLQLVQLQTHMNITAHTSSSISSEWTVALSTLHDHQPLTNAHTHTTSNLSKAHVTRDNSVPATWGIVYSMQ